jgi:Tol biopolymer transport system component
VALDERLRRAIDRAGEPVDPSGVYEGLIRRRERRLIIRRVQAGVLAVAVVAGCMVGIYALTRVVQPGGNTPAIDISPMPTVPHENGRIAYSLSTGSGMELHSVQADGSDDRTIPTPPGLPWLHAWAPDGSKIAVAIFPGGGGERAIWVMNADGSNPLQVARSENVSVPSWSPDGSTIAYAARADGRTEIHLVNPDGSSDRIVHAQGAEGTFSIFSAQFSPDGTQILFVMDTDGTNVRRVTTTGSDYDPHWSPDGTQIVFTRQEVVEAGGRSVATSDIFVMKADGSDVRRLTNGDDRNTNLYPQWAPDGTKIAYLAGITGGPGALVVMNADGSNPVSLVERNVVGISWQALPLPNISVEPTPMPPGEDLGLGFPVCNVSSIKGRFASPEANATLSVATKAGDLGGCPQPEAAFNVVALDTDQDGVADVSFGPIECTLECRAFSAPDIDGDGTGEALVVQDGGSVVGLRLYDIVATGGEPEIVPVDIADPGDPQSGLLSGEQASFLLGGDEFELYTLRCEEIPLPWGLGLVATSAEARPHDSTDAEWHAHQTTSVLRSDGLLHILDVRDFTEPVTDDPDGPSFRSGETLCGSNLGPPVPIP